MRGTGRSLTRCLRAERELQLPIIIIDPIFRLHVVRIDMREPTDVGFLKVVALRVEEVVIRLRRGGGGRVGYESQ